MSARRCFYCDQAAGLEGLTPYEAGGTVERLHPSCMAAMLAAGSCSGDDDDEPFEPRALTEGGEA